MYKEVMCLIKKHLYDLGMDGKIILNLILKWNLKYMVQNKLPQNRVLAGCCR